MGEERNLLEGLLQELRRGTLVLSVLSQIKEEKYGYSLIQMLEEKGVPIDPNTLYPLLRRLEKQGLLESCWETGGSRPRKYYRRTDYGDEVYAQLKEQWKELAEGMERLLREDEV
ncbi:MAG TPA: PadR family transcriptional regulator [Candidatus Eisenbergiella pullicola]|mgnify:FL=1|nr:PadR family transcriptional regulator [Candidatus Eisenbergiella pullicola]